MYNIHTLRTRCGHFLLCFCLLLAMLPVYTAAAEETTPKVVRVGWYEDAYNITGENGERSGYGYEYEQSVAAYTGWTYEYVKAGWSELFEMMENGEIDLMAGISYTDERAEEMLFSDLPMGTERYYLYADLQHTDISASDLATLNGKRVALMKTSVQATQFYDWEAAHDLHLQYVWANSFEQGKEQAANREIDCVVSTETPQWVEFGMSAIATVGGSDIYFAINKNRPDLKQELDTAMRKMENDKPFYADELYQRYLSAVASPTLDQDEQNWLAEHGPIRIGYLKNDAGVSTYIPASGKAVGVINDYITMASDCMGTGTLDFTSTGYDSMSDLVQALRDDKIDLIFHFTQNPYIAEECGFALTNTVLSFNMAAVTKQNYFDETAANTAAIAKDDLLVKWYIAYNYPTWKIAEYDSARAAEEAVRNGQADCLVADAGKLSQYNDNKALHYVFLTQSGNTSFAITRGNSTLMSILNKTLKTIPASMLTGAMSGYEASLQKVTVMDFIKDNLLAVAMGFIAVFLLILLLILGFLHKSQVAEAKARQAASDAQELNRKLQLSQHELQTALQTAETASKAKTDFLASMSHDIRTPMNAIIGLTTLMENDLTNIEKLQEYLGKLKASSQHLLNLINEILDMNKIEAGKATLHVAPFNMAEQVTQIESVIRPQTKARNQKFIIQTHNIRHENIEGDATRLQQVLLNILSNSVKYTDRGGHIELNIEEMPRTGHYARYKFTVTDDGMGMSEEFQKHIFESFTRAENTVTNRVQGTGLGMAITKNIVDMMGGAITLESELNKGTRFEVMLEFKIDEKADSAMQGLNLLLLRCDDEHFARVRAATENHPINICRSTNPQQTEELLAKHHYDVILVPYQLYGKKLKADVDRLRKQTDSDTILLGVAVVQRTDALDEISAGGLDGFVPLPFFLSNLESEVKLVRERRTTNAPQENKSLLVGMHFLCAEDNALNAEILQAMMEMKGASCTMCSDGAEIVEKFKTVKPGEYDAILMDVQMPKMNGYDATRAIRNGDNPLGRTIPIIAMTANAFSEDVQKSYEAGMDAHLSKPVDMAALETTLRKFRSTPPENDEKIKP